MRLAVVSASIEPLRTYQFWRSWTEKAEVMPYRVLVWNCNKPEEAQHRPSTGWDIVITVPHPMGSVPAFRLGIAAAALEADVIACLHDDVEIRKQGWDQEILYHFKENPLCGLAGFSGADGLGAGDIYRTPYDPMQLARQGFFSNMVDAEKHGRRETAKRRSACADGFSLIGRRDFMVGAYNEFHKWGVIHHAFDSWLGMIAYRDGFECWFLPVSCHHAGGFTAVGSAQYAAWIKQKYENGDQGVWERAHRAFYEAGRGILPYKVRA